MGQKSSIWNIYIFSLFQNNWGRRAQRYTWVFGIVTTQHLPAKSYFDEVERRDMATLHPIISRCVLPGTEVHSDDLASYRQTDQRINNTSNDCSPTQLRWPSHYGVDTQEIESCWNSLKLGQKTRRRIRREDLQSYLDEQMWRRWRAGTAQQSMQNFLAVVANQYLVDNPVL